MKIQKIKFFPALLIALISCVSDQNNGNWNPRIDKIILEALNTEKVDGISVGISCAWLMSSLMLPSVISTKDWDPRSKAIVQASIFEKLVDRIADMVVLYPKYVFSSGLIMVLVGLMGLYKITIDVNVASFFKPGTEIRDSMDIMDEEMSGTMDLRVRLNADLKDPMGLQKMDSLQSYIETNDQIKVTYSIANVVKQMHRTVMDDSLEYEAIPMEREKVNNLFTMYSMSGDPEDFSSLVDYEYSSGLITALSSVMSTEDVFLFVESISEYIKGHFSVANDISVTGMIVVIRDMVIMVIRSSLFSIIISIFKSFHFIFF